MCIKIDLSEIRKPHIISPNPEIMCIQVITPSRLCSAIASVSVRLALIISDIIKNATMV